jgi:hypothetical protein
MEEKWETGQFGHAKFLVEKNCKKTPMDLYGTITMIDKKYIWFTDNDNYPYLVLKKDFSFEKAEFKILT